MYLLKSKPRGSFTPHNTIGSRETPSFSKRPPSPEQSTNLSNIGDSSSLFSYRTPPAYEFAGSTDLDSENNSPIPFVFGASEPSKEQQGWNRMVNERSPAKSPLNSIAPNDQPPKMADPSYPSKPQPTAAPQFGLPTLPQSPLHKHAQKESSVFIQPKSRPEHHRDGQGMLICC